jgi:hypothetical protein
MPVATGSSAHVEDVDATPSWPYWLAPQQTDVLSGRIPHVNPLPAVIDVSRSALESPHASAKAAATATNGHSASRGNRIIAAGNGERVI